MTLTLTEILQQFKASTDCNSHIFALDLTTKFQHNKPEQVKMCMINILYVKKQLW